MGCGKTGSSEPATVTEKGGKASENKGSSSATSLVPPEVFAEIANIVAPDVEKCYALFDGVDTDGSGAVDRSELARLFEAVGVNANPAVVDAMMTIVDDNNSGKLSKKEFAQVVYIVQNIGSSSSVPRIMFLNADKDFSGTIDLKEFKYICENAGLCKGADKQESIFKQLCKPGQNVVNYNVFCHAVDKLIK